MTGQELHAEAHRLKADHGYGARRIGQELGISRHAATLLLAQPQPLPQPVAATAPVQVAEAAEEWPPVAEPASPAEPVAVDEQPPVPEVAAAPQPVAEERLPGAEPVAEVAVERRPVAAEAAEPVGHVAGVARLFRIPGARGPWLQVDLSGRPWVVRDLMRLVRLGLQIPYVVDIAVRSFAAAYHQAVTRGDLVPGQAYEVRTIVRPCSHTT